ncbi:hypothetical protein V6N11_031306 [Hibiscus sabdariffa]|uniref:Uncharacterized protein n=1 Tax=Hibiscus sabdariffa TaxID=183260 RepID=A0ABR2SX83_9ROSI
MSKACIKSNHIHSPPAAESWAVKGQRICQDTTPSIVKVQLQVSLTKCIKFLTRKKEVTTLWQEKRDGQVSTFQETIIASDGEGIVLTLENSQKTSRSNGGSA